MYFNWVLKKIPEGEEPSLDEMDRIVGRGWVYLVSTAMFVIFWPALVISKTFKLYKTKNKENDTAK